MEVVPASSNRKHDYSQMDRIPVVSDILSLELLEQKAKELEQTPHFIAYDVYPPAGNAQRRKDSNPQWRFCVFE